MPTETLHASSFNTNSGCTAPENALGAANGVWTTNTGNVSWSCQFQIPAPVTGTPTGTQGIAVLMRKDALLGGAVTASITVWQQGSQIATIATDAAVTGLGGPVSGTFDASAMTPTLPIDVRVVVTAAGGNPNNRRTAQVDEVEWTANVVVAVPSGAAAGGFGFTGTSVGARASSGSATGSAVFAGTVQLL